MTTYKLLIKTIETKNKAFDRGTISADEYIAWKKDTIKKMDVFLLNDRITDDQYSELMSMFKDIEA